MAYSKEDLMEAKKQIWGVGENMGTEESLSLIHILEKTATEFYKSRDRHHTPEYDKVTWQIKKAQKQLKTATGQEKTALLQNIAQLTAVMHKTPCMSKTDKVIKYIRYADDFIPVSYTHLAGRAGGNALYRPGND